MAFFLIQVVTCLLFGLRDSYLEELAITMSITTAYAETNAALPYWLVNVPTSEWPEKCPGFLISITDIDRGNLSIPDNQYRRLSWNEVQEYVSRMISTSC